MLQFERQQSILRFLQEHQTAKVAQIAKAIYTKDKVYRDVVYSAILQSFDRCGGLLGCVAAVHKAQLLVVERLHAETHSVDSRLTQFTHILCRNVVGVDLEGNLLYVLAVKEFGCVVDKVL